MTASRGRPRGPEIDPGHHRRCGTTPSAPVEPARERDEVLSRHRDDNRSCGTLQLRGTSLSQGFWPWHCCRESTAHLRSVLAGTRPVARGCRTRARHLQRDCRCPWWPDRSIVTGVRLPRVVRPAPQHLAAVVAHDVPRAQRQVRRGSPPRHDVAGREMRQVRQPSRQRCQPHCLGPSCASTPRTHPAATSI